MIYQDLILTRYYIYNIYVCVCACINSNHLVLSTGNKHGTWFSSNIKELSLSLSLWSENNRACLEAENTILEMKYLPELLYISNHLIFSTHSRCVWGRRGGFLWAISLGGRICSLKLRLRNSNMIPQTHPCAMNISTNHLVFWYSHSVIP